MIKTDLPNKWRGRIIRYAPLILWISVVFTASSTAGASKNTSIIIRPLLEWLFPLDSAATLDVYHGYIRKCAHFAEYGMLAFFASRAFWNSSVLIVRRFWFLLAFLTVVSISSIDEYNQSLNILRTGAIYDVFLDCFGGISMILALLAIRYFRKIK